MESKPVSEYEVDDRIDAFLVVRRRELKEYSGGRNISLELGDATGRINGVIWEPDQFALSELETGMVVKVRGVVGLYRDRPQLTVKLIRMAEEKEYELETVLPHSPQSNEQRKARILAATEKIENSYTRALADLFWSDEAFFSEFLRVPAGKLWHHAYIGGLSEHSANVAELVMRVAVGYSHLDLDLLVFGGLFHDVGKVATYTSGTVFDYTDEGRLVGHINIADAWICERAARVDGFPRQLLTKLRHMVVSHQGYLEFGAPVVPQMPEAFVLYYCDELDAKMGAIDRIRQRHDGKGWSSYVKLLDRFLYFGEKPE